ncbi:protein NipSnap homolog 3A [Xyrichtys novacula]|uniref:Protein NipSnap homolog 3A n=2 Tax=Xyrichtys novacula TaxID=13765 RepID=A0AAV1FF31_XYRNO|nr:protein NipSnap homolog 3A [Xyrichtys novacula]
MRRSLSAGELSLSLSLFLSLFSCWFHSLSLSVCLVMMMMMKFRISALRAAAAKLSPVTPAAQPSVDFSRGPQQEHQTFYELRTYNIHPHLNSAFIQLTNEKIHLRTAHSQLIGYWTVEYGGLNKVFHIWKYDSYSHRAGVRSALSKDPTWVSDYLSKAIPMLSSQENEVAYLLPWSQLQTPPQEGGVYELASFSMRPGGPAVWGDAFQASILSHDAPGYSKLIGAFHNEFGPLNKVYALWWYESADKRAEVRHKAHTDARVVAAVRSSVAQLVSQENKLMFPLPFSPLK